MTTDSRVQYEDEQRLDQWLGHIYRSDVLGIGDKSETEQVVRGVLDADQRMQEAAKRKLMRLDAICKSRDEKSAFVEHWQWKKLKDLVAA